MKKETDKLIIMTLFLCILYWLCYTINLIELNRVRKINEQLRIEYNELKENYDKLCQ